MIKICNKDYDELFMDIDSPARINVSCDYVSQWVISEKQSQETCSFSGDCDFCVVMEIKDYLKKIKI